MLCCSIKIFKTTTTIFSSSSSSTWPSALLVIGHKFGATTTDNVLHVLPEDNSTIERFSITTTSSPNTTTTFRFGGAREQRREQIGTVTLHVGDGETTYSFLDDVDTRIRSLLQLRNLLRSNSTATSMSMSTMSTQLQTETQTVSVEEVAQLVQDVLRPAALDAIQAREGRERSMNATQTYAVYIIYIKRSRPGQIMTDAELTSFPH